MESRLAACLRGRQAARERIKLAAEAVEQARAELAGTADEKRCGALLTFVDLQMALAMKALSADDGGARILRLRPSGVER